MKLKYKGFEIEVTREKSITKYILLFYSIMRISDGWEFVSGSRDSDETVRELVSEMKEYVDEYLEDPKKWEKENLNKEDDDGQKSEKGSAS